MKNIFKSFLTLASVAAVFASCTQEAKPLASSVSLDKTEVVFEGQNAPAQTVTVKADGDWFAVAPEWITLEPAAGSGETEVKVSVADNTDEWKELAGPRSASVSFCYGTTGISVLSVQQKGENGLDASRQYSKITKADEFEAGSYLVVFDNNGDKSAFAVNNNSTEGNFQYMGVFAVTESDGTIATENAVNAFSFDAAEGGYTIKMSNGRYLMLKDGKTGFYSTDAVANASIWTVEFDENGFATIKSDSFYIQLSLKYGTAGAYSSEQDNALMPILYKDSKPASDEVLSVPEKVSVASNVTTATIAVTSNKTWKVRCHDEWITTFTESGSGNGEIVLTFTANESKTDARAASIQVIGETTNFVVEFIQNKVATSVSEISGQLISTDKNAQSPYAADLSEAGAVVSYVNGGSAYIEDKTGAILLYKSSHGLTAGQKVAGKVSGYGYLYSALPEITSLEGAEISEGGEIPCTEITIADLLKDYNSYLSRRVLIKGVKVTDAIDGSDRDGKIEFGGNSIAVRAQLKTLNMPLGTCDIICFPALYNKNKQLAFWEDAHCTYTEIAGSVSVSEVSLKLGETGKVSYTTNNTEGVVTYSIDKTDIATVAADGTITAVAEGEATLTVKVAAAGIYTAAEATAKVTVVAAGLPESPAFVKVTSSSEIVDGGTYLIVYEEGSLAFDGSLTKLDVASNTVSINISAGKIGMSSEVEDKTFTIEEGKYLKSASGYYIGATSDANKIVSSQTDKYENKLSIDAEGNFVVESVNKPFLRYNSNVNQARFRYYKSASYTDQQAIQLYKLAE